MKWYQILVNRYTSDPVNRYSGTRSTSHPVNRCSDTRYNLSNPHK